MICFLKIIFFSSGELVMHIVFSWLRGRSYLCMNNGVISQLFITLLDTEDSCSREATILLPQLSRSGLYTVFKPQLLHNRAVCVCVPQLMGLVRRGWDRGEDKGQDIRGEAGRRPDRADVREWEREDSEGGRWVLDCLKASAATASAHSQLRVSPLSWRWCLAKRIWQLSLIWCLSNNRWTTHGDYYS